MERLDGIIRRVEEGEIGLEEALAEYERGVGLVRRCREVLATVEQRVEELARLADPSKAARPTAPDAAPAAGGADEDAPF
ncbi:MAG: exodeoxyribonuclease VII small subunit [Phycisphaeraceae bacterium]|nr:MAG: exodeoxyribonuclease VII small subunit [Phycisphaeraceae bacterium]